ncbi:F-box only protein 3 [Parasteatoda tepidariorum]|uniref:F-box only protein 3 n=1 Tax=Parasteatoda tepidariorum TaxID=114398 RepID=UPI00077F8DF9|nr:F-box only protein 3 [Parasteatoda tepidariorum]
MNIRRGLCDLPNEILANILSYLDYKDLRNVKFVNRKLSGLTKQEKFWRNYCVKYWLLTECPEGQTWEDTFIKWFKDMGAYINYYKILKTAWDNIKNYYQLNNPQMYSTIMGGASEEELNALERRLHFVLPLDYRCSYRICSGQEFSSPGIMGSMSSPGWYRTETLLDLNTVSVVGFRERDGLKGCIPLTLCLHSGVIQYLAVTDEDGYEPNTIFYPMDMESGRERSSVDAFISGTSFQEWVTSHANHLTKNDYVSIQNQPFTFLHDSAAVETTGYITVSVATCFLPELSKINPPKFHHTYRITMSMSSAACELDECQLETRHWTITDENGSEELVDGPGVVGEYPVMYPGASFSWVSSTSFNTTYGNMKGYFRMRNLKSHERFKVNCPIFHMKCYPYVTEEEREFNKAKKRELKKQA